MFAQQPGLGELARERLIEPGVLLVVTIRKDGTPRLSPVEPFLLGDELWLSMMLGSRKAADLRRDSRILVHSVITSPDGQEGEIKLRGTARHEQSHNAQQRYADAVADALPWSPEVGRFHLFAVDIGHVTYIRYDTATGDQHVALWPPAKEFLRRATSAKSVGDEVPIRQIFR